MDKKSVWSVVIFMAFEVLCVGAVVYTYTTHINEAYLVNTANTIVTAPYIAIQ